MKLLLSDADHSTGYGESNMAKPVPFFPGRIIPLFPFSALVMAWLYLNKAQLDKGSIPFEA